MKKEGDESEDSQRTIIKTFAKVYKKEGFGSEGRKEQGDKIKRGERTGNVLFFFLKGGGCT